MNFACLTFCLRPLRSLVARAALAALIVCGIAQTCQADLTWTNKTAELKADARTTTLEAKFHFTNSGRQAIDVRKIESSCGCTTAELEQRHYEPGQSGDIVARYTVGSHVGLQTKTIAVITSASDEPTILTLAVQIPEILRITPPYVTWKHDEATTAKHITLELLQATPISDITVQSSNAGVAVAMEEVVKGRKYQLNVTPAQTKQLIFATLTIRCVYGEEEKTFRAFATVRPAVPEGK